MLVRNLLLSCSMTDLLQQIHLIYAETDPAPEDLFLWVQELWKQKTAFYAVETLAWLMTNLYGEELLCMVDDIDTCLPTGQMLLNLKP